MTDYTHLHAEHANARSEIESLKVELNLAQSFLEAEQEIGRGQTAQIESLKQQLEAERTLKESALADLSHYGAQITEALESLAIVKKELVAAHEILSDIVALDINSHKKNILYIQELARRELANG